MIAILYRIILYFVWLQGGLVGLQQFSFFLVIFFLR